jgi:glycerophosphoryl diester phosphodiesterase
VAYTVNDAEDARRLWRDGVRTLITDRPDALIAAAPR